ncbi:helix-turn-helix transcriptional regulator [Streptomyces sp. NPDC058872]|uniref:helix-turn-helix domain-containing protein n=1 Tax=Streptomyces sp. NPDC058872 TaxID=3346661 RepID=UPI00368ECF9F
MWFTPSSTARLSTAADVSGSFAGPAISRARRPFPRLGDAERAVLRALAAGHTDEAASRRLGVSLRTYRRRVAALMAALDARSRFQAGLRAREILGRRSDS